MDEALTRLNLHDPITSDDWDDPEPEIDDGDSEELVVLEPPPTTTPVPDIPMVATSTEHGAAGSFHADPLHLENTPDPFYQSSADLVRDVHSCSSNLIHQHLAI